MLNTHMKTLIKNYIIIFIKFSRYENGKIII